jgi:hypothetical protein
MLHPQEVFEKPYRKVNEFLRKGDYVGAVTVFSGNHMRTKYTSLQIAFTGWCFC